MINILGIVVSFLYVFLILFLARFVEKFGKEISRKFVHILSSNWWFIGMFLFDNALLAAIPPAVFILLNYLSYRKNLFGSMERGEKEKKDLGTVYYAISLFVLSLLTLGRGLPAAYIGAAGILTMGYADGLAAVLGQAIRSPRLPFSHKTVSGTVVMFATTLLVLLVFTFLGGVPFAIAVSVGVALIATAVELFTPLGLDNITVPLAVSGLYFLAERWR